MGSEVITMMPMWGSICLGQVILAYTLNHGENPKVFGSSFKPL